MRKVRIRIGKSSMEVELQDTPTADAIFLAAPFESRATTWEGEVYFTVPVKAELEPGARSVVKPGELAYRVEGEVVVIAYGPTLLSEGEEIRLARPENIWGRCDVDIRAMAKVEPGELIVVEPVTAED
jgi:hypothetical protein